MTKNGEAIARDPNHVRIFDTTLRDGQQCPGAGMGYDENLAYARLAMKLGVDVLEAGFAAASSLDFEIVRAIAKELAPQPGSPIIATLCQTRSEQVDRSIEALEPAIKFGKARMHIYVPVDPNLMAASLGKHGENKQQILKDVGEFISRAVKAGLEVEFSPEGYSRMGKNESFVLDLIRSAVGAGATTINCPDTIGGAYRFQGEDFFASKMAKQASVIAKEFPEQDVIWSVHCHNDFGLAVENSLTGVFEGPARQIEGCINGIGERAGNVSLEQVIMAIKHFAKLVNPDAPLYTKINTEVLGEISDFTAKHMLPRQPHFPVTGENACKHSAGGHTNAVIKDPLIYQPFNPKEVGKEISLLFGPLSGGNHAKSIIEAAGYLCKDEEKAEVAQFIKDLFSERRKGITDSEVVAGYIEYRSPVRIENYDYAKSANRSEVILRGKVFEERGEIRATHEGRDSALAALTSLLGRSFPGTSVQHHSSQSAGEGVDAVSISTILLKDSLGEVYTGEGRDQDIEVAAMKALVAAVNRCYVERHFRINESA